MPSNPTFTFLIVNIKLLIHLCLTIGLDGFTFLIVNIKRPEYVEHKELMDDLHSS